MSDRRRAENESRFRAANEQIEEKAVELGIHDAVPFLCECANEDCRDILLLSLTDFRDARASATRFAIAPGHDSAPDAIVERRGSFELVEKQGEEARVLEEEGAQADGS